MDLINESYISGNSGERLSYQFTADTNGGDFSPGSGSIILNGTTGTITTTYTAPSTTGTYIQRVRVTNSEDNWVKNDFDTTVVYVKANS